MSGNQKGFTLIELLVVIAILGVIAAVVALNIAGFFGRGTLQAANTELHQAQTAIIAMMADAESNLIITGGSTNVTWAGESGTIIVPGTDGIDRDASSYIYGPFRAVYTVNVDPDSGVYGIGQITHGDCDPGTSGLDKPWGTAIEWATEFMNWRTATP